MNTTNHIHGRGAACCLVLAVLAGSALAQPAEMNPEVLRAMPGAAREEFLRNNPQAAAVTPPPEALARRNSGETWRRGSNVEPAAFGQIDEFTYQLRKEDLVRWDNPNIRAPLHLEWIQDWPQPIDKRTFRTIDPKAEFDPDHVYVAFKPGTTLEQQEAAHKAIGGTIRWTSEMVPNLYQVTTGGRGVVGAVNAYLDIPEVMYAEPCYIMQAELDPNDPQYNELWGLLDNEIGGSLAREAWDDGGGWTGDPNFVIAVIDTGVQINCTDLNANQWVNPSPSPQAPYNGTDLYGWNVADNTGDVLPCGNAHGTHVAGTIGAVGNNGQLVVGVNWRCKIMTLRCNGHGDCSGLWATETALDYAVSRGAKVSNNSYGSLGSPGATAYSQLIAAQSAGHIFVAAAGNNGIDVDGAQAHYPSGYNLSNIISVLAIQPNSGIATFSNHGWTSVDLGAPGTGIVSTVPPCGTDSFQGTSMASPHVAGATALVWGRYPGLEWWKVKQRICEGTYNPYVACAFQAQLNCWKAIGYWVGTAGTPGIGTYYYPLPPNQFADALNAIPTYGTVTLRDGAAVTNAPATITKPMQIRATSPVTITR